MFPRHAEPLLAEALADTPVVLLNGARQTGKSTLVQALAARDGRRYLTLDGRVVLYGGSALVAFSERLLAVPLSWWWAGA